MHVILFVLGVLCIVAGLAPVLWGLDYPFDERNALMLRGTIAIIGGLILIALGAVISHLQRIGEAIETLKLASVASATPAPAAPDLAQAIAAEPPRRPMAETSAFAEAVDLPRDSKLSMLPPEEASKAVARESPVMEWPHVDAADRFASAVANASTARAAAPAAAAESIPTSRAEEAPKADAEQSLPTPKPTILKSGVIEGIPYTAYSDGSFEAEFTEGTKRFGSFSELRMHFSSRGIA